MPAYSFTEPRLYVENPLGAGAEITLGREQSHYLLNVMRLKDGEEVLLFNGRDGEWRASVARSGRKEAVLSVKLETRAQTPLPDIDYCFAPLKQARLDYMVQKAVEMGARRLIPVLTERTQVRKLNLERIHANIVEAAEQCGILSLAEITEPMSLEAFLANRGERLLVFCDERAEESGLSPTPEIKARADAHGVSVLIGPEGGFGEKERAQLRAQNNSLILGLGPRILRADTAAVAALTLVQSRFGDW